MGGLGVVGRTVDAVTVATAANSPSDKLNEIVRLSAHGETRGHVPYFENTRKPRNPRHVRDKVFVSHWTTTGRPRQRMLGVLFWFGPDVLVAM